MRDGKFDAKCCTSIYSLVTDTPYVHYSFSKVHHRKKFQQLNQQHVKWQKLVLCLLVCLICTSNIQGTQHLSPRLYPPLRIYHKSYTCFNCFVLGLIIKSDRIMHNYSLKWLRRYAEEIYQHMRSREEALMIDPNYLRRQWVTCKISTAELYFLCDM